MEDTKLNFEAYLKKHKVDQLFQELTEEVIKNRPQNLFGFLVHSLEEKAKMLKIERRVIFVLGGPGSGKGTQCARLVDTGKFVHFSAGDLLRAEVKKGNERGKMIQNHITNGTIVPGHVTIGLLRNAILEADPEKIVLVDGFPREMKQCLDFERDVCPCDFCLYFSCSEKTLRDRILKRAKESKVKRKDDNEEVIIKRFRTFIKTTWPVIEYFKADGRVKEVSAEKGVDEIFKEVENLFK